MMNIGDYNASLVVASPPTEISPALQALWWARKGDWDKAHKIAQQQDDAEGAWVHAYLHRVEGDLGNAGYWYHRAGKEQARNPLDDEWNQIVRALLL